MNQQLLQIVYIGLLLPGLFALTLVADGIYKISRHEEGFFTFVLGVLFLASLTIVYLYLVNR